MNHLMTIIGISTIGIAIAILIRFKQVKTIDANLIGIKFRRGSIVKIQRGGTMTIIPFLESYSILDSSIQSVNLDKELIISHEGQSVPVRGELQFKIEHPDKFLELVNNPTSDDLMYKITTSLKTAIFEIIKTDLWGRGKIDLLKNEKKTLDELKNNILYNLELEQDELIKFELAFDIKV